MDGLQPDHDAAHRAIPLRGRGSVLGESARRVRRDHHLRRQLPRRDADDAARRLPPAGDQPRVVLHPQPRPAGGLACGAGGTQASLAGLGMSLDVEVGLALGPLRMEMEVTVEEGEVVALLGPNGAGKTTLLRAIAGLVPIDSGHVRLDGEVLEDPSAGRYVPTERRSIGFVFQDYLLFPHLSVLDNIAFGLRTRGATREKADQRARDWLGRF